MNESLALTLAPWPALSNVEVCYRDIFNISSYGILENYEAPSVIFGYALPLLELQIIIIFVLIIISRVFLRFIGVPQFVSYMITGLLLGRHLFDLLDFSSDRLSLDVALDGNIALEGVANLGLIMFTFLMGVKTNKRAVFHIGKGTVAIAVLSFLVTMTAGLAFRNFHIDKADPLYMPLKLAPTERTVIVSVQALTLLPVITHLVYELKIPNSELGRLAISIATVNDLLGFITLQCVSYVASYRYVSPRIANRDALAMTILILVILFIIKPTAQWIVDTSPEGKPVRELYVYGTIITAIAASICTSYFHQVHVLGAILVGMAIPDGPPLGSALEAKFEGLVTNIFFPISIVVMTMKADISKVFYAFDDITINIFLVGFTLVVKWTATFGSCLIFKLPTQESIILAIMMNYKGFVDLCFFEGAANHWNLSQATHTFVIIYVLVIAGVLPTIVKTLYDPKRKYIGYVKREIMHLKPNSDLKILTCLHKPDNISGVLSLLQLLSFPPNDESNKDRGVIAVTALHLVKLAGRSFPILIPHDKRTKPQLRQNSYIQTMMLVLSEFQQENWASTTVSFFTAYSHEDLMDHDICNLALDHHTSMIIVPSGRKWSPDGLYESDNTVIRSVNASLLDRAPCSIGVLNDRSYRTKKKSNGTVNVGVIFIGGKDDREALSLAKWMRQNPRVRLTVIRFLSGREPDKSKNWDYLVDNEVLSNLKETYAPAENFSYAEKIVNGGPAVATAVRLAAEDYDLMIVGRGRDDDLLDVSGLAEWMELPELGVIGDLLACKDLKTRVSVLVVQQQQQHE
ncbi:Cation/H(+) antiporter 9 [Raphanus sativus]|uniref:Cation/H(+) antiporter 9 n=1 Tax=Raphanus sativus TaxID=3726 RepID=A0A6J0KA28_RAPSA|nr:cation/H(+) antiporter 9 [Raphanus sativus]KAJ4883685.1 Cation/H(+) antiporter 9 [Raphanus sativus]